MKKRFLYYSLSFFLITLLLSSCNYKQNILFRTSGNLDTLRTKNKLEEAKSNYRININDKLEIQLFTYGGELILDPNKELAREIGMSSNMSNMRVKTQSYLVQADSAIFLPKIGKVNVFGYTLFECDTMLARRFEEFYQDPFVVTEVINRRISIIGPSGSKVIPLENEKVSLIEVIALYGDISNSARMQKIRIIRGDLKNPEVQVVDLTTIEGMKKANLEIKANDIVYIEPTKKILSESLKDVSPLISLITSTISLYVLFTSFSK